MKKTLKKSFLKSIVIFIVTIGMIGAIGLGIQTMKESKEAVQVIGEKVLVPGGQSVGIQMNVKGVLVVGLEEIETKDSVVSPGYLAGLQNRRYDSFD